MLHFDVLTFGIFASVWVWLFENPRPFFNLPETPGDSSHTSWVNATSLAETFWSNA